MTLPALATVLANNSPITDSLLKVYGERNSGTRYLEFLVAANLRVQLLRGGAPRFVTWLGPDSEVMRDRYFRLTVYRNLGWKHRLPPAEVELARADSVIRTVRFLTMVKNPYSWVLSMLRRPYSTARSYASLEELVTSPWMTVGRECAPAQFPSAIAMWNAKAAANLALPVGRTANLRYEDLIADPEATIDALSLSLGLERRGESFCNRHASTKRSSQTFEDYRRYYLERRWRDKLTDGEVRLISERLDPAVMAAYRYDIL